MPRATSKKPVRKVAPKTPAKEVIPRLVPVEVPVIVPAPPGTFVLHVKKNMDIMIHVCTHFERYSDRLVPRGMIAADDDVIEAAVLHPTGHVSGSPKMPMTFENVEQYRTNLAAKYLPPEEDMVG